LTFTLSWDNSWRDNFNWDAVWLFVKYKKEGSTDAWSHLYLGGEQTGTSVLEIDPGNTGNQVVGAFVYPKNKGAFNIAGERVTLKASLNGLSASDISDKKVYFAVSAIEMVLIPYGAYYLGDGVSNLCFHEAYVAERNPIRLNGYKSLDASSIHSNHNASLPVNAIDNNMGTHYHSAGIEDEWFMIDFGMRKEMRYFTISTHYGGTGYFLEGSNDKSTWSVLWSGNGSAWSQTLSKYRITNPGAYQYYRFRETGNYLVIYDVALWENDAPSVWVDSESLLYYRVSRNSLTENLQIPATYPKGYKGFYIMKYELSQEQYCNFLNMLSYTQQKSRIGNNLDNLNRGDYVFGNPKKPSCRNGIAVFSRKNTSQPAVFGCNLNPAEPFFDKDDGQTLACNYMTGADMLAYLDWSGLRPMSELEYEKACRTPNRVMPGEYAWNTTSVTSLGGQGGLTGSTLGTENESPANMNTNANSGTPSFGPVRCGSFGTSNTNQEQSGGSFYGVMELSGNLGEMYYSVTGGSYLNTNPTSASNNEYHGDGTIATNGDFNVVTYWNRSNDATAFSVRGGSFASPDSYLRVSDRRVLMSYNNVTRDSTVTFRGGRSLRHVIDAGKIGSDATCPGLVTINSIQEAKTYGDSSYVWYVKRPENTFFELIEGEHGANLVNYDLVSVGRASTVAYTFRRKVMTLTDEAVAEFTLTVPNMLWEISPSTVEINSCGDADELIATSIISNGTSYEWKYNGNNLSTINTYQPSLSDFGGHSGNNEIVCTMSRNNCKVERTVVVKVPQIITVRSTEVTMANCGNVVFVDGRDSKVYCTEKIGNQCWMGQSLNIGDYRKVSNATPWDFNTAGIQKWCKDNDAANCDIYGGMYEWWEVVCGGYCENLSLDQAENLTLADESALGAYGAKYTPDGTKVKGICPDGWHLPTFNEWNMAINNGGSKNLLDGKCWSRYNNSFHVQTVFWSSQPYDASGAHGAWIDLYAGITTLRLGNYSSHFYNYTNYRSYGHYVRCIKD